MDCLLIQLLFLRWENHGQGESWDITLEQFDHSKECVNVSENKHHHDRGFATCWIIQGAAFEELDEVDEWVSALRPRVDVQMIASARYS